MTLQEKKQKQYNQYVARVTPVHNTFRNMVKAFVSGGTVCTLGQILYNILIKVGFTKEDAGIWMMLALIACAVILTMFHVFGKMTRFAGAGMLVPITGFANSVASPAIEYAPEGEVFGKGVQIFSIAGPVILYGVLSSWIVGLIYWGMKILGI